jgi:hypothetical protein
MTGDMPRLLRIASISLLVNVVALVISLFVGGAPGYLTSFGLGSAGLGMAAGCFLLFFIGELRSGRLDE